MEILSFFNQNNSIIHSENTCLSQNQQYKFLSPATFLAVLSTND
jgi:hypothetical protein